MSDERYKLSKFMTIVKSKKVGRVELFLLKEKHSDLQDYIEMITPERIIVIRNIKPHVDKTKLFDGIALLIESGSFETLVSLLDFTPYQVTCNFEAK